MAALETVLVTCEHAVNRIPRPYAGCFTAARGELAAHEGLDLGALWAARRLARAFAAPIEIGEVSRLLVDLNRSFDHPRLFSKYSARLSDEDKEAVLERYYYPYRNRVEGWIRQRIAAGERVLHVSVHSFVPVLRGVERNAEIGLLYDPARAREKKLCAEWASALRRLLPGYRVRRNYPYRGVSDGLTVHLRRCFPDRSYRGGEIELNQACLVESESGRGAMVRAIAEGLRAAAALAP